MTSLLFRGSAVFSVRAVGGSYRQKYMLLVMEHVPEVASTVHNRIRDWVICKLCTD